MWLSLHEKRRGKEKFGFLFLIPGYRFTVDSEVRQNQNLEGWGVGGNPVQYR